MADRLRIVEFDVGGRPYGLFDLEQINLGVAGRVSKERDSFRIVPGQPNRTDSAGTDRFDGSRTVAEKVGNGQISARWAVKGASAQEALDNAATLLEHVRDGTSRGRYIEWRPDGAYRSTYFEIRGPAEWSPDYRRIVFAQIFRMAVEVTWQVAPLGELDRMDIRDGFDLPPDAELVETNLITNPRAAIDLAGIGSASAGVALARATAGLPNGAPTGVEAVGTAVATTTAIYGSFGRTGAGIGLAAHPVPPGATIAARGWFEVTSIGAGAITNVNMRMYWYQADGTASATAFTTVQAIANPVIGTDYEPAGIVAVPADAAFAVPRFVATQTNPTTATLRMTQVAMFEIAATDTVVPAYFDAWSDRTRSKGAEHASETELYDRGPADDYEFVAGTPGIAVANGALRNTNVSTKTYRHTARGYAYADAQHAIKINLGADPTQAIDTRLIIKYIDANNYLYVRTSTGSGLHLRKVDNGADAAALSTSASAAFVAGQPIWLRGRAEGNTLTAEVWLNEPSPMGTPAGTCSYTLTGAEAAKFGIGVATPPHLMFTSPDLDVSWDDYRVEPYTYSAATLPAPFELLAIPGDRHAPAKLNLHVTPAGGAAPPAWAMVGWWPRRAAYNRLWNGAFETSTAGWSLSATISPFLTAGFSGTLNVVSTPGSYKYGSQGGELAITAAPSTNAGATFPIYGRFKKGTTYKFRIWARQTAGVANSLQAVLGYDAGDSAAGAATPMTVGANHVELEIDWTPTADRLVAYPTLRQTAAGAATYQIDGAEVGEARRLPARRDVPGGIPAIGEIPAEANISPSLATADANYRNGYGVKQAASGAGTKVLQWHLDTSVLEPDAFAGDEIDIEVWARLDIPAGLVTPKAILAAIPWDTSNANQWRYTAEHGAAGKLLTKPSTGQAFRPVRLGTLTLHVDRQAPITWLLQLTLSWAVGSSGTIGADSLYSMPIDARAVSGPTGRAYSATDYPVFVPTTAETRRVVRHDGSGWMAAGSRNLSPAPGMSRALELDPGDSEAFVVLSSLVPDDPTADATSEQKDYAATVHFEVVPRVHLARGS